MNCTVKDLSTCYICNNTFKQREFIRQVKCKCEKHSNIVAFCGLSVDICPQCSEAGWGSLSGNGGGKTGALNHNTGERK